LSIELKGTVVASFGDFGEGGLSAAVSKTIEDVKQRPTDPALRTRLFELLCFQGDFDRAEKHLDVIGHQDADADWAAQVYHNILAAERNRRRLWTEGLAPEFLLDPPDEIQWHLQAINQLRARQPSAALALLDKSADQRPEIIARIGEQPVANFRDCDDVLAPVLEFIILRDYVWLPLQQVAELEVSKPESPRDLLWIPVRVELHDGTQRRGYMPVLYPGSHEHPDDQVKLGQMTDWRETPDGPVLGVGQRTFLYGDEGVPTLELPPVRFEMANEG